MMINFTVPEENGKKVLTMDEYIKREEAIHIAFKSPFFSDSLMEEIKAIPAADVAPVRHARWIEVREKRLFGEHYFLCSNCKSRNGLMIPFNYCPNCGAKMDKKKEKEV